MAFPAPPRIQLVAYPPVNPQYHANAYPYQPLGGFPPAPPPTVIHKLKSSAGAIDFQAELVTVKVGHMASVYVVHGNILTENSNFFHAALSKQGREGPKRVISLPHQNASTFNTYLNWVYRHELPLKPDQLDRADIDDLQYQLVELYALGGVFLDSDLKDAVTDAFAVSCHSGAHGSIAVPDLATRSQIYQRTAPGSILRNLLVTIMTTPSFASHIDINDHHQFVVDVALKHGDEGKNAVQDAVVDCEYHEHEQGEENCYRNKFGGVQKEFPIN